MPPIFGFILVAFFFVCVWGGGGCGGGGGGGGFWGIYAKNYINSVISDTAHEKAFTMVF